MSVLRTHTAAAVLALGLGATQTTAGENVMVVFDGSNSMWGQIDGKAKIEIARGVMSNLLGEWTEDREVGLMAYGHRTRGDCTDIETLVAPGSGTRGDILARINAITPTGKTPLTDAVQRAAEELAYTDQPATVVLISDGLESCDRDPCALAEALEKGGVGFTAHVVGFGLAGDADAASLSCIAEETGGQYISASNAQELGNALSAVSTAVAEPIETITPTEPEPEPPTFPVTVLGPKTAVGGSEITVSWGPTFNEGDYITIVPLGADKDTFGPYLTVGKVTEKPIVIPGGEGIYEIRYVANDNGYKVLGTTELEITKPQVILTAADTLPAGAETDIAWDPTIYSGDYITIVPAGSDPATYGPYATTGQSTDTTLNAPGTPGLYEVRYVLRVDERTVASRMLELTKPDVTLVVPQSAPAGSAVPISWGPTINRADYITIVAAGADEGTFGTYFSVYDNSRGEINAPATPGIYEVRYVLNSQSKTAASAIIEVTEAQVGLTIPERVDAGAEFAVSWDRTINYQDYINIVPAGADEGKFGNYFTVYDKVKGKLAAPAEPGIYEVRYVLNEGYKTAGSATIEVTEPQINVTAPDAVVTGSDFPVSWDRVINSSDYINIVPAVADEGTFGNYVTVRDKLKGKLTAPADPGLYEVRYVLNQGYKTAGSVTIEVTLPEVTISAPETVTMGSKFMVSWTGTVNVDDYVTVVPMGTEEGEYGNYAVVRDKGESTLNAPATPGMYEVRYVLRQGVKTMARTMVEVVEPSITLTAPETALAGSKVTINWSAPVNPNDYITVVPVGTDEGEYGNYVVVRAETSKELQMPSETGMYEIRYVLREGVQTMARSMIEITAPEITVTAPDEAIAGSKIPVSWTGTVSLSDYITIVPVGTDEGEYGTYFQVRDKTEKDLRAPADTGMYEIRYVLREGARTMTSTLIEITEPQVTLATVDAVRAGDDFVVSWTNAVDDSDYITIVPVGTPDGKYGDYVQARGKSEKSLTAPDETGLYEVRYVLREGPRVLVRHPIEVLAKDAALDTGASITAPESAAPGSVITVTWSVTSDSKDQRITLARPDQAIFTWIAAVKIKDTTSAEIELPADSGVYELRFLDVSNQEVLSRKVIRVQ